MRRWGALVVLVLAMTAGLVACDPPAGSGLTIKATTTTTGLEPGDPITIRIAGAEPNQTVVLYPCLTGDGGWCRPPTHQRRTVTVGPDGAATVRWNAVGQVSQEAWGDDRMGVRPAACRPPAGCTLHVATGFDEELGADGQVGPIGRAETSVPFTLRGRQVQFTATPTQDLQGGEAIAVCGTAPGAAGRRVRIACIWEYTRFNEQGIEKGGSSVYVTVRADGSLSGTFPLPADPSEADCSLQDDFLRCHLSAWVVKADGSGMDKSFGEPMVPLWFAPDERPLESR